MRQWLRKVLPNDTVIAVFCMAYVGLIVAYWLDSRLLQGQGRPDILLLKDRLLALSAALYGVVRVAGMHPVWDRGYREWLERTPWTIERPLPVGPVRLVPQDGVVLLLLVLLSLYEPLFLNPARLPIYFLCGYLGMLALTESATGQSGFGYALAFGLGLVVRFWANWQISLALAAVLYPVALAGLRLSYLCFPWSLSKTVEQHMDLKLEMTSSKSQQQEFADQSLGFPFDRMSPKSVPDGISYRNGVGLSLLAGWWVYVVTSRLDELLGIRPGFLLMATMIPLFACWGMTIIRLSRYCWNYRPPISLFGRIFTLRWLVPGYDRVLVTPLLTCAVPLAVASVLIQYEPLPPAVCAAIPVTVALLILLNMGPTFKNWQLTGSHRVVPGYSQQAGQQSPFIEI